MKLVHIMVKIQSYSKFANKSVIATRLICLLVKSSKGASMVLGVVLENTRNPIHFLVASFEQLSFAVDRVTISFGVITTPVCTQSPTFPFLDQIGSIQE